MSKDEKIAHIREVVENYSINLLGKEGFLPEDVISLVRAGQFIVYVWLHWSLISSSGLLNKEIRTSFEKRLRFWLIAFTIAVTAFYLPLAFAIMMYLVADAFSVLESSLATIFVIQWWAGWLIMPSYIFFSGYLLIYPEVNLGKMTVIARNTGSSSIQQASDQDDIELLNKLLAKEKVWLDPELNIYALSKLSGLSTRRTSYLLNNYYNENFNSVVNRCRIEYAIEKIKKGYLNQFTTDSLWKECGFSNQSTFFSSFKKITGSTPVEYSKSIHSTN
jgi:AraC-like DNA-binding protein